MWSEMYQCGYDNAAISFAYIPDFKSEKERLDFNRGLKDGYAKIELLKSGNIAQQGQPAMSTQRAIGADFVRNYSRDFNN